MSLGSDEFAVVGEFEVKLSSSILSGRLTLKWNGSQVQSFACYLKIHDSGAFYWLSLKLIINLIVSSIFKGKRTTRVSKSKFYMNIPDFSFFVLSLTNCFRF